MGTRVKWANQKCLQFNDLEVNQAFKIDTGRAAGAVYIKVECGHRDLRLGKKQNWLPPTEHTYAMLEVATGKIFEPTTSPVCPVDVEININDIKPSIY